MVGKIFLAKIFFTDITDHKIRPVLIIYKYKDEDYLFLPLTTNLKITGISIKSSDLQSGQLKKPSIIIVPKISIIHKSLLMREIGMVKIDILKQVMGKVCSDLGCKK